MRAFTLSTWEEAETVRSLWIWDQPDLLASLGYRIWPSQKWNNFKKNLWIFCLHVCMVPAEVRRGCWMPWNWSYRWQPYGCWELNMGPLQEQLSQLSSLGKNKSWHIALILVIWGQRQVALYKVKASLVYKATSGTQGHTEKPCPKKTKPNQQKEKNLEPSMTCSCSFISKINGQWNEPTKIFHLLFLRMHIWVNCLWLFFLSVSAGSK